MMLNRLGVGAFLSLLSVVLLATGWPGVVLAESEEERRTRLTAAERERLIEEACRDAKGRPESWLDRTHSYVNQRLCEPAAWFDGFFGDPRAAEETPVGTFVRLRNELRWDESEGWRYRVRMSANVSLPGVTDRVRLLVSRDADVRGEFEEEDRFEGSEERTRLGLRFIASDRERDRFDIDGTVRVRTTGLNPLVRARYRHTRPLTETTLARYTQIIFWEREDGFGTTTRGDWEWLPDFRTQVRLTGRGTYSEESDGIEWATSAIGFRQLNRRTAVRAEIGALGFTEPSFETKEYFVNLRWRRSFLRPWLFYEIQPEHAWPLDMETGNRRSDWRIFFTIEVQFENEPARRERIREVLGEDVDPDEIDEEEAPLRHYRDM